MKRNGAARPDPRLAQLRATFGVELDQRSRVLAALLPRLGHRAADAFGSALRDIHSLKGAARAAELPEVEQLAHAIESAIAAARRLDRRPSEAWLATLGKALDTIVPLAGAELSSNRQLPRAWPAILDELASLPSSVPAPTPSEPVAPTKLPAPRAEAHASAAGAAESIRVNVGKLDRLLAQAGELAVTHIRVEQRLHELTNLRRELDTWRREWRGTRELRATLRATPRGTGPNDETASVDLERVLRFLDRAEQRSQAILQRVDDVTAQLGRDRAQLGLISRAFEDEILAARLLPVETVVGPFERLVRDLTRQIGKDARLVIEGSETEIDRKILELLRDPLMHMLRNAVDHGLETPEERQSRGKPRQGSIHLTVSQRGGVVELVLEDDGIGLDPAALRQAAIRKNLLSPDQALALDDSAARHLIFEPGFSTRTTVDETSGRGVGMDVVREHVERLNGRVDVDSEPGQGTRFTIVVPLTVATTRAILVDQAGQLFAIPSATVERNARIKASEIVSLEGRRAVPVEGHPVPSVELSDALELPRLDADDSAWRSFIILRQREQRLALLVDRLVGEQEIVVKSVGWPLRRVRNVSGAALLGSGRTVVILNPSDLFKSGLALVSGGVRPSVAPAEAARGRRKPRLLVVDDSVMTRTLERSILEAAGYETLVAADGVEALNLLRAQPIDLVVSDVEMPLLDGFGLTAEVRRDEKLRHIPMVLVTSLGSPEHRERGVAAGADAYVVKSEFDQGQLLDVVGRLL